MTTFVTRCACWGLLVAALGTIAGCPNPATDDPTSPAGDDQSAVDGAPNAGEEGDSQREEQPAPGGGGLFTDCGSRTVTSAPGPGYLEMSFSIDVDVTPTDAPLAKVLFGSFLCQDDFASLALPMLYEVGQGGEVLSTISLFEMEGAKVYMRTDQPGEQWFAVEDGCFTLAYDAERFEFDPTYDLEHTYITPGPCGLGLPTITRQGQVFTAPDGEYVCLSGVVSYCRDCWGGDGAWHSETVVSGSYSTLGSLDNVSVAGWSTACNQPDQTVDIRDGDRVEFSYTIRMTYRTSPSPEELGYQLFEYPTYP